MACVMRSIRGACCDGGDAFRHPRPEDLVQDRRRHGSRRRRHRPAYRPRRNRRRGGRVGLRQDGDGTIDVAAAIIAESTLSFLGLGFPPDIPTWGRVLFDAKDTMDIAPHWVLFSGGAIFLAVLTINFIGDGLRDALDPRRVL